MRRAVHAAFALGSPPEASGHAGGQAVFIKKNELLAALVILPLSPLLCGQAHVFSLPLAGVQSFSKAPNSNIEPVPKGGNLEPDILLFALANQAD